jgi:sphingolipid delta-4 desaturase
MGKGGCAVAKQDIVSVLEKEREDKVQKQPKFYWAHDEEPHRRTKQEILGKHPSLKQYMGIDTSTKFKVAFWVAFQLLSLHVLQGAPWYTWLLCCYTLSGSINHMMTLAMHELSHNLGAKGVTPNRFLAILANLPMGIPAAASFKRYHMEHHKFQGEDVVDVDIPTEWEGWFFHSSPRKVLWCLLQPLFYSLRPLAVNPKEPTRWEFINIACIIAFDLSIVYVWGVRELLYLVIGTLFGMGLHPVSGHFIAEHYVMHEGQETFSYYGPLNWLTFNVGYHNEHHDFANISGRHLPDVRRIAPEYYDAIPHYHSWIKVIYDYIVDDGISPYSRTKRVTMEKKEIDALRARGGLVK